MKSKKEYIILGGIIVLMVLYLALHKTNRTYYELPKLSQLKKADITSIKIAKKDKTIEIKKKDDKWMILPENYPADTAKVDAMLDVISGLTLTALVSESANYGLYDLDNDHKIDVQAMEGDKQVRDFDIGKAASSHQHTFIKFPDDKRVYHARENFKSKFDVTTDALRDLTVLAFEKSQIQQIEISQKDKDLLTLSLKQEPVEVSAKPEEATKEKQETKEEKQPAAKEDKKAEKEAPPKMVWQDAAGKPAKEADVNELLETMSKLKCKKFIDGKTKGDFTPPICTVKFQGTKTYELSIFDKVNKEDNTYPAISSGSEYPFELPQYRVDDIMKKF
jgi:hypothetical protein